MKLPIDIQNIQFIAANAPEPLMDFDSRQQRTDSDGKAIFVLNVIALTKEGAEVLTVKVSDPPKGITQGLSVKITGLVATTWQMSDRHGVSFRADKIEIFHVSPRAATA